MEDRATLPSPMPPQVHPERSLDDVLEDSAQIHTALGDREGALATLEKTQSLIDRTRAIVVQPSLRERCAEFARSVIRRRADSQVGENRSKSFEVSLIGGLVHYSAVDGDTNELARVRGVGHGKVEFAL